LQIPITVSREPDDAFHDRRKAGQRAGAQIVAIGEAAGYDDAIHATQRALLVPQAHDGLAKHLLERVRGVGIIE
jgi:hypothetical protein